MLNFKEKMEKINAVEGSIPFMEDRTKGDISTGIVTTLKDYGYIKGEDGLYAVMDFEEYPDFFFFGGSVVTKKLQEVDLVLTPEEKASALEQGIPVIFTRKKNKSGKKEYTTCEFYPNTEI